jgi:hypothetical protein
MQKKTLEIGMNVQNHAMLAAMPMKMAWAAS